MPRRKKGQGKSPPVTTDGGGGGLPHTLIKKPCPPACTRCEAIYAARLIDFQNCAGDLTCEANIQAIYNDEIANCTS